MFICGKWRYAIGENMVTRNIRVNKKAFVNTVGIKSADLKGNFFALEFCPPPNCLDIGKGRRLPCDS